MWFDPVVNATIMEAVLVVLVFVIAYKLGGRL